MLIALALLLYLSLVVIQAYSLDSVFNEMCKPTSNHQSTHRNKIIKEMVDAWFIAINCGWNFPIDKI